MGEMAGTGLADVTKTGYKFLDSYLIIAFVERWKEETSSFHMSSGEITLILDDVPCLVHLVIEGASAGPPANDQR
jgi:hypothetical protein